MEFISGYVWQGDYQKHCKEALILLQATYGRIPMLFACICSGENVKGGEEAAEYVTKQLIDWFYQEGIHLSQMKQKKVISNMLKRLLLELEYYEQKTGTHTKCQITLFFAAGKRFWLVRNESEKIFLLNRRLCYSNIREIIERNKSNTEGILTVTEGNLQEGVGILLCTNEFVENITLESIKNCLFVGEISTDEQIEKRMKELGKEGTNKEGIGSGIFFLAKSSIKIGNGKERYLGIHREKRL